MLICKFDSGENKSLKYKESLSWNNQTFRYLNVLKTKKARNGDVFSQQEHHLSFFFLFFPPQVSETFLTSSHSVAL